MAYLAEEGTQRNAECRPIGHTHCGLIECGTYNCTGRDTDCHPKTVPHKTSQKLQLEGTVLVLRLYEVGGEL